MRRNQRLFQASLESLLEKRRSRVTEVTTERTIAQSDITPVVFMVCLCVSLLRSCIDNATVTGTERQPHFLPVRRVILRQHFHHDSRRNTGSVDRQLLDWKVRSQVVSGAVLRVDRHVSAAVLGVRKGNRQLVLRHQWHHCESEHHGRLLYCLHLYSRSLPVFAPRYRDRFLLCFFQDRLYSQPSHFHSPHPTFSSYSGHYLWDCCSFGCFDFPSTSSWNCQSSSLWYPSWFDTSWSRCFPSSSIHS